MNFIKSFFIKDKGKKNISKYIGNYTHTGWHGENIHTYFLDFKQMFNIPKDLKHSLQIDKEEFFDIVNFKVIPKELKVFIENSDQPHLEYWVRTFDTYLRPLTPDNWKLFWIYDSFDDVYYFFFQRIN
jgi:hypothetical protein